MATKKNCNELLPTKKMKCSDKQINYEKHYFNPLTKEVLNECKSYIGQGEIVEGVLVITRKPI